MVKEFLSQNIVLFKEMLEVFINLLSSLLVICVEKPRVFILAENCSELYV